MYNNVLIICASYHHFNTLKLASAIGEELNAKIINPEEFDIQTIDEYDLIGFGSGIYNQKHHQSILDLIDKLSMQNQKPTFIFSTCTVPVKAIHRILKEMLAKKGFYIIGEFTCKGYMNIPITKYFGGFNKGRPNDNDMEKARIFARNL